MHLLILPYSHHGIERWQAEYAKWDTKALLSRRRPVDYFVSLEHAPSHFAIQQLLKLTKRLG
jgi:hypothetical protein